MAFICTITAATKKADNNIGDVVSIQDTPPNERERLLFTVTEVGGNASEIYAQMQSALPERKMVWLDGKEYKEIKKDPLYPAKYINGVFEHTYSDKVENSEVIADKKS